jgi:hypothetical protein
MAGIATKMNAFLPIVEESVRLLPDSIVLMSGFLAFITLSFPFAVFFGSLLESIAFFYLIKASAASSSFSFVKKTADSYKSACRTGFSASSLSDLSMFNMSKIDTAFPSAPIYIISAAIGYIYSAITSEQRELNALGPKYSARVSISIFGLLIILFLVTAYRIYNTCETPFTLFLTMPLGIFIGALLTYQNFSLLGPDSINLLGIPLLRNRAVSGETLYLCTKSDH